MREVEIGVRNLVRWHSMMKLLIACVVLQGVTPLVAADWPHWRGPHDNGSTQQGTYPVKWDATNVLWKTPLPGKGCSTPIIWDQHIFLTAPSNGLDAVLAFDWDGKPLWQTTLGPEHQGSHWNG